MAYTTQVIMEAFNAQCKKIIEEHDGISANQMMEKYGISQSTKNKLSLLSGKIFSEYLDADLYSDDIIFKTIHLNKYSDLKESISLRSFKYCELIEAEWHTSDLYTLFNEKYFAFVIFKDSEKDTFLNRIVVWKMPQDKLNNDVYRVWNEVRELIKVGKIVKYIDDEGRYHTYFPALSNSKYVHVRPHAQSRNDTYPLPVADKLTGLVEFPKHSFWLNRSYILKILSGAEECSLVK